MFNICPSNCGATINATGKDCCAGNKSRKAAIKAILFLSCMVNPETVDLSNETQVKELRAQGKLGALIRIVGQKADTSFQKKVIDGCAPEKIVGATQQITWEDYEFDQANDCFDFYNQIQEEAHLFFAGYYTCDGQFFGWINQFSGQSDHIIPPNSNDLQYWKGQIMWNDVSQLKPISSPNLIEWLCGSDTTEGDFTPDVVQDEFIVNPDTAGHVVNLEFMRDEDCVGVITTTVETSDPGIVVAPVPSAGGLTANTTFDVGGVPVGDYTITFTSTGCGKTKVVTVPVKVRTASPSFRLSTGASVSVSAGGSVDVPYIIDNEGCTGDITVSLLSVTPAEAGITATPVVESSTPDYGQVSNNLTIDVDGGVSPGFYTLIIQASGCSVTKQAATLIEVL